MTDEKQIKDMSYEELHALVFELVGIRDLTNTQKGQIIDRLSSLCWSIGLLWDKVAGIDPHKGPDRIYGTRNRRSKTYKLRKAAGYSYP